MRVVKVLLTHAVAFTLASCGTNEGAGVPPLPPSSEPAPSPTPPSVVIDLPPKPVPTPPAPSPSPTPTPALTYDCTNHPVTAKAFVHSSGTYNISFASDCTYQFATSAHISYGIWAPEPDPTEIIQTPPQVSYPLVLMPTGAYVCLPANGPQNCTNYAFAGDVFIRVEVQNPAVSLIIENR